MAKKKDLSNKEYISIKGARMHNLKNIDVAIPKNKFVVITGLSGSGKSSLAFDTLFAEGQRRYVESLSSYARQFLGRLDKPDVDSISGISPAIAIEQKVTSTNPRSTVGTTTEIYDYLKLLFTRIGKTYSPVSGKVVKRHTIEDIVNYVSSLKDDTKLSLLAPLVIGKDRTIEKQLDILVQQGFSRLQFKGEIVRIDETKLKKTDLKDTFLLVDRFTAKSSEENISRVFDSTQTAFYEGAGTCFIQDTDGNKKEFNNRFESDGITFEEPSVNFFNFNSPQGACKTCEGFGSVIGIDPELVIPNKTISVFDDAVVCWKGDKMQKWKNELVFSASEFDFPIHKPYNQLTKEQQKLLWTGNKHFKGLNKFFKYVESKMYKIQYRVMLSRYRGKTLCPDCNGSRIRKDANYVKINGYSITDMVTMPIVDLKSVFDKMKLSDNEKTIAKRLLTDINNRIDYILNVGLGYLTLNRLSNSLSGGESQRINLATSLGSSLVGSMYILDEPSIGLHSKDTKKLIKVLRSLQELGNTVIVVEHDEDIMLEADHIIDMGPMAGSLGGEVIFEGNFKALNKDKTSLTAQYLTGKIEIPFNKKRRTSKNIIKILGARENNLKNINVKFPLNTLSVVTGVSGSGKSTLIKRVLYPLLRKHMNIHSEKNGECDSVEGALNNIEAVEFVDQNPIGKSSRSNPVTYVKAYDDIRALFSKQQLSLVNGYKPAHFSFNVAGGRCDVCDGEGSVTIEMQFMADVKLKCEACKGKRFKDEILEVEFKGKSIYDILCLTVDEAINFFKEDTGNICKKILTKLQPLQDVGLGYVQLGQSSSTLSGGEAQRIKLASFLIKGKRAAKTLFIFDEPTTGLHFHDIQKLLISINALINQGHSILIIEHNLDVIKNADWIIDLGPDGGEKGGNLVFQGTPEEMIKCKNSFTAEYLKSKLN